jgi:hypothetical protein
MAVKAVCFSNELMIVCRVHLGQGDKCFNIGDTFSPTDWLDKSTIGVAEAAACECVGFHIQ